MLIIIEGLVMCLFLLLYCVIGIANGPVGLVVLYEKAEGSGTAKITQP